MRRIVTLCIICIFTLSLLTGCGNSADNNVINISILNSKPEIADALETALNEFEKENEDIRIKTVKYSQSSSYKDKLEAMVSADNAPTLTIVDAAYISALSDICLDLSTEKWVNDISQGISNIVKNDKGEIIAFPFSTEGAGFIYNKKVLDEAGIDVSTLNTISALEEAFQKVNSIGKGSLIITNEEWSLGDHFLATFYAADVKKSGTDNKTYFENIKRNAENIGSNETLNGLLDTFDIMKKYNIYADSPLAPSYDKCAEILGTGEVGFWYMGNWASQNILTASSGNSEFGFIPVPISNNSSDIGNNEIAFGVTKYIIVNKNSSEKQIEAAKRFLDYIVYDERGNKFIAEDAGIIPAFENISVPEKDPLVKEIINYRDAGNTVELMNSYLPSNNSKILGNALRKYLNNEITREQLIDQIKDFWRNS